MLNKMYVATLLVLLSSAVVDVHADATATGQLAQVDTAKQAAKPLSNADKEAEKAARKQARKDAKAARKAAKRQQKLADSKDPRVCKRQRVTGSRIPEKVCRKESEWERIRERARENVERTKEGADRAIGGAGES